MIDADQQREQPPDDRREDLRRRLARLGAGGSLPLPSPGAPRPRRHWSEVELDDEEHDQEAD